MATKLDSVEIRWPSGLTERFDKAAIDQINTVKEGTGVAVSDDPAEEAVRRTPRAAKDSYRDEFIAYYAISSLFTR